MTNLVRAAALLLASVAALAACDRAPTPTPTPPLTQTPTPAPRRIVRLSPAGAMVLVGGALQFQATSAQIPRANWIWRVSDTSLARVSVTGLVQARRPGMVFVQACDHTTSACGNTALNIMEAPSTKP